MSIRLICLCGRGMSLPVKYAGQHVQCPNCRAMLRIPTAQEDFALTRWFCKCGLRLKARARTGGQKLRCPRCSAEAVVPFAEGHPSYVEENFLLDEASGVVQKAAEKPPKDLAAIQKSERPPEVPPAKKLRSAGSPAKGGAETRTAPKPATAQAGKPAIAPAGKPTETPAEPELILEPENPDAGPPSPKDEDVGFYELAPMPDAEPAPALRPPPSPLKSEAKKRKTPPS